jgi:hypothetical protein
MVGEEAGPPSPRGIDWDECQYRGEDGERVSDRCPPSRVPCGWGTAPPFIGQGGNSLHACCTIFLRVEAWRAAPRSWRPSWRILLESMCRGVSCAHKGVASRAPSTGGPYAAQWRSWRHLVPAHSNSIGDVVTVPGVALQWRGWSHRVDNDGEDRSRRPDVTAYPCAVTEKAFEGSAGPPSRARRVSRTRVGDTVSRSWHQPHRTVLHSGGDGLPQGVGETAPGCDSRACQGRGARPAVSEH